MALTLKTLNNDLPGGTKYSIRSQWEQGLVDYGVVVFAMGTPVKIVAFVSWKEITPKHNIVSKFISIL